MRGHLIEKMKSDIESTLRTFLHEEGIELYVAANDNSDYSGLPLVELETLSDQPLEGSALLTEIRVILGILGKPWQCEVLVGGIYEALHPHNLTHGELTVLLMSLHIESAHCVRPRHLKKRAIVQYVVEEAPTVDSRPKGDIPAITKVKSECC